MHPKPIRDTTAPWEPSFTLAISIPALDGCLTPPIPRNIPCRAGPIAQGLAAAHDCSSDWVDGQLTAAELNAVMIHELAHASRLDDLAAAFVHAVLYRACSGFTRCSEATRCNPEACLRRRGYPGWHSTCNLHIRLTKGLPLSSSAASSRCCRGGIGNNVSQPAR